MSEPLRFAHVSLVVANTATSLAFYCDLLGFKQDFTRPEMSFAGAWLEIGPGEQIHLLEVDNPDPVSGRPDHGGRDRHTAFTIQQLTPLAAKLSEAGISYSMSQSGRKALFCRDPDGNALEFIELPA